MRRNAAVATHCVCLGATKTTLSHAKPVVRVMVNAVTCRHNRSTFFSRPIIFPLTHLSSISLLVRSWFQHESTPPPQHLVRNQAKKTISFYVSSTISRPRQGEKSWASFFPLPLRLHGTDTLLATPSLPPSLLLAMHDETLNKTRPTSSARSPTC